MDKKKIIIGVLIGVVIIGGIYLYRKNKKKSNSKTSGDTEKNIDESTEATQPTESTQPTSKVADKSVSESTTKSSDDILKEVLKNTLGKGKMKKTVKGVDYVELVINDPFKKPYTWKFYGNQKFEVFDAKNVLTFRGSYRNSALRLIIGADNYENGTTNLVGISITGKSIEEIANKMFTLK